MIQNVDLGDNRNLFVVSVILICCVGGLVVSFGKVTITEVAAALILGIVTNLICNIGRNKNDVALESATTSNEEANAAPVEEEKAPEVDETTAPEETTKEE